MLGFLYVKINSYTLVVNEIDKKTYSYNKKFTCIQRKSPNSYKVKNPIEKQPTTQNTRFIYKKQNGKFKQILNSHQAKGPAITQIEEKLRKPPHSS